MQYFKSSWKSKNLWIDPANFFKITSKKILKPNTHNICNFSCRFVYRWCFLDSAFDIFNLFSFFFRQGISNTALGAQIATSHGVDWSGVTGTTFACHSKHRWWWQEPCPEEDALDWIWWLCTNRQPIPAQPADGVGLLQKNRGQIYVNAFPDDMDH